MQHKKLSITPYNIIDLRKHILLHTFLLSTVLSYSQQYRSNAIVSIQNNTLPPINNTLKDTVQINVSLEGAYVNEKGELGDTSCQLLITNLHLFKFKGTLQ